jgi:hypothetical protein
MMRLRPGALALGLALLVSAGRAHARSITVHIPPYTVPARSDREICTFVEVSADKALEITGIEVVNQGTTTEVSSHHFIVYAYTGTNMAGYEVLRGKDVDSHACISFGPGDPTQLQFVGGTQTPRARQHYPKGLALQIEPNSTGAVGKAPAVGLVLNSHWINGSDQAHTARVKLRLRLTSAKHVKQELKPIFEVVANAFLDVAPGQVHGTGWQWGPGLPNLGRFLGGTEFPTGPACVTSVTGHMHRRGKEFTVDYVDKTAATRRLYDNDLYDEPGQALLNPPLLVSPGEKLTYHCTQDNGVTTDQKMGCEETAGTPPGLTPIQVFGKSSNFSGAAKRCTSDADCVGVGTGHCVPANLVFGYTSDDDMCILPGYYYDADPTKPAGHECDLD